jgi:phosphate transport system substrate-binding protein
MKYIGYYLSLLGLVSAFSCGVPEESATRGNVRIAVDESFNPLLEAEREAFMATYKNVKVRPSYVSEGKAVGLLLSDSAMLSIIGRELDSTERSILAKDKLKYRSFKIAEDAVVLVSHKENLDSLMSMENLAHIFNGKINTWKELGNSSISMPDSIIVVFDKGNSSNLHFIKSRLGIEQEKIKIFSASGNQEVIEYVSQHKGALGFIGLSWISDRDTRKSRELRQMVRLIWVGDKDSTGKPAYTLPYQSELALKTYPLTRSVICISREPGTGPATGFLNYMTSDIGQRIVLKLGIMPAKLPPRNLQIK